MGLLGLLVVTYHLPHLKKPLPCVFPCGRKTTKKEPKDQLIGRGIFNLSDVSFTPQELKMLDLGLKFAPSKPLDKFELHVDLKKFLRKLNIKKFFLENPPDARENNINSEFQHTNVRNNSLFNLQLFKNSKFFL